MRNAVCAVLGGMLASLALAQTSPFVPENVDRALANEVSGDRAFEFERLSTQWHKPSGSEGFFAVAALVEERARAAGLADVRRIDQVGLTASWTPKRAEAWLLEGTAASPKETLLGSFADAKTSIADYSRPADVTAELVDVGSGERASDYAGKDVRGKIVLAFGNIGAVMDQAVWTRGAAGILSWNASRLNALAEHPDQIAWAGVPEDDGPHGEKTTFAFVISARQGKALVDRLAGESSRRWGAGDAKKSEALRVRVVVESATLPEKKTAMIEARIPGTDPSLPEVVLTSHLQENISANDNQSGVASMLEIGRALTKLIGEGKVARPRRGIRFWWCDEIYSEYRYFADHPGEEKKVLANLNQDMVGAKQSDGSRTEFMARTPWWRPSYLSDVQESVLDMVVHGNNAYLAAWASGSIPPGIAFSKPLFSVRGTREPYHAKAVPYFDSTDHMVFNDSWVGVPGTTLTNWPDEYIHSSDDDLWQVDPTQLKRNAFVVAATAWWLASAGEAEAGWLADYVASRGAARLARDRATAQNWVREGEGSETDRRRAANELVTVGLTKEVAAVESTRTLGASEAARSRAVASLRAAAAPLADGLSSPATPDPALARLAGRTPRRAVSTLSAWMALEHETGLKRAVQARADREAKEKDEEARRSGRARKGAAAPPAADDGEKLSPLMEAAVMNRVDGKTNAADISRAVCAEALSAGWWYYGKTTPELVEKFLTRQVKDGLLAW
ncbi:MAG TPA: M28 family peptidase [Thermoanaerobaculia bacterium]|nr:M28 family peptidase [Thermoanaerobaculia bacterium]